VLLILSYPVPFPFFLLTAHEAIAAHLWELAFRLFLRVWRLTHLITFHRVGFLHRWVTPVCLDDFITNG
jgi:hypothetical protein